MRKGGKFQGDKTVGAVFADAVKSRAQQSAKAPRVTLRLTDEEMATLKHLSAGMTVSAYIRRCLFGKDAAPSKIRLRAPVQDQEALGRVLGLLGRSRIANNLNQLAYNANCGTLLLDQQTEEQLNEAYAHVLSMRADLTQALGTNGTSQH